MKQQIAVLNRYNVLQAQIWAERFSLDTTNFYDTRYQFFLTPTLNALELHSHTGKPWRVTWGLQKKCGFTHLLARACGLKAGNAQPTIVDATMGWGQDAYLLAQWGCTVCGLERNRIVHALLADGLRRCDASGIQVIHTDSISYLNNLSIYPDIIYLDPMFPKRLKNAACQKKMHVLRALVHEPNDIICLFELAQKKAKKRIVVKQARWTSPFRAPNFQIIGKCIRFDVYQPR